MNLTDRKSNYPIESLLLHRHSPRAMTGETLSDQEIQTLFEAARWAPSCYNEQPWRFLYAKKNTANFDLFFDFLVDFNKKWCKNAAILGVVVSGKLFEKNQKPNSTYQYDAGAAWENLALQGFKMGLVTHGMSGFDAAKAKEKLLVPDTFDVLAMFAVGKKGKKEDLDEELQKKEVFSTRKSLDQIVKEGKFGF